MKLYQKQTLVLLAAIWPLTAPAQESKPRLLGLINGKSHSLAVLELGKEKGFLKAGDRLAGYTLKAFRKRSVILNRDGLDYELAVGEGGLHRSYENENENTAPAIPSDMQAPAEDYAPDIIDEPVNDGDDQSFGG